MKMLSSVLGALSLLAAFAAPAAAQVEAGFGVEFGANVSYLTISEGERSAGPGFLAGVFAVAPITPAIVLQPGVQFTQRRSEYTTSRGVTNEIDVNYLAVPVVVRMPFFWNMLISEGVSFNFPMSATRTVGGADTDIKDNVTSPDISIVIGAGKAVADRIDIQGRYEIGYRQLYKTIPAGEGGKRHRSLQFVIGVRF